MLCIFAIFSFIENNEYSVIAIIICSRLYCEYWSLYKKILYIGMSQESSKETMFNMSFALVDC